MSSNESSPINERLSAAVDMYGQPCLLLAQHIAHEAESLARQQWLYHRSDTIFGSHRKEQNTVPLISQPDTEPTVGNFSTSILTDHCLDPDNRVTELRLATHYTTTKLVRGRFRKQTTWLNWLDTDRPMYIFAVARNLNVPVLRIKPDGPGNCSFITLFNAEAEDEIIVTEDDLEDPVREARLKEIYSFFRQINLLKHNDEHEDAPLPPANITAMGLLDTVRHALGETTPTKEAIIKKLQLMVTNESNKSCSTTIKTTVNIRDVNYPAQVTLGVAESADGRLLAHTSLSLPGSTSVQNVDFLPLLNVYPNLTNPLQFENTSDENQEGLIQEFADLLKINSID